MLIGNYNGKYIGKTMCGFVNGHEYNIDIDKNIYGYIIFGIKNLTEDMKSYAFINYSSENSIRRNWIIE